MKASKITISFGVALILYGALAVHVNWTPLWHFKAPHPLWDCLHRNFMEKGSVMAGVAIMVSGLAIMFTAGHHAVKAHFHKHGLK